MGAACGCGIHGVVETCGCSAEWMKLVGAAVNAAFREVEACGCNCECGIQGG